jgi:hypothetical protein
MANCVIAARHYLKRTLNVGFRLGIGPATLLNLSRLRAEGGSRDSLSFASWQERKHLSGVLRAIYRAPSAEAAAAELDAFAESPWGKKYPPIVSAWRRNWEQVVPFFAFAPEKRRRAAASSRSRPRTAPSSGFRDR